MCGRVSQKSFHKYHLRRFGLVDEFDERPGRNMPVRYNLRPTERSIIVARHPNGEIKTVEAVWWAQYDGARSFSTKFKTFNIRVERMHQSNLWRPLLEQGKRCIFPIDSFYEWPVKGRGKPPVEIFVKYREPYALAGLWSTFYEDGIEKYSFATFTVEPNEFMRDLHPNAMPVILDSFEKQERWLVDGDESLLIPYGGEMESTQLEKTLENLYPDENASEQPVIVEQPDLFAANS